MLSALDVNTETEDSMTATQKRKITEDVQDKRRRVFLLDEKH